MAKISDAERYKVRVQGEEIVMVKLYNCDPSRPRANWHGGIEYKIPPLGFEGNPMDVTEETARHVCSVFAKSAVGVRGWVIYGDGAKEIYESKVVDLKKNGYVTNPQDPFVKADRATLAVLSPEDEQKLKAQAMTDKLLEKVGMNPKDAITKKEPVSIQV